MFVNSWIHTIRFFVVVELVAVAAVAVVEIAVVAGIATVFGVVHIALLML